MNRKGSCSRQFPQIVDKTAEGTGLRRSFPGTELLLWGFSALLISASFLSFDRANYLNLAASLIGIIGTTLSLDFASLIGDAAAS